MKTLLQGTQNSELKSQLAAVDVEFKDYLSQLAFKKPLCGETLATFSPLDAVNSFEQRGLQQLHEVSSEEMLNNGDALKKLLANMLAHCKPGQLSDEDMDQLSGINGREIHAGA